MEKEWLEYYKLKIGDYISIGGYDGLRVPGGIMLSRIIEETNGSYGSDKQITLSITDTYIPFPPSLKQKLELL